ncbi:ABC transporter G family member 2 [Stylophora pistillata]|uniref:ABC transporter G family member 2 n=1 Tax=Stylophora pistillata TaxID=50429 RepID=A0A2B4SNC9_STYPI|nr:ABC transporter G family member 2 [Stylophora pistillata]
MNRKILGNKDAMCNDGTRAVYYLDVQKPSKWIIFLESGAYCLTKAQCLARFGSKLTNALMTSKYMPRKISGRDLLSTSWNENKLFYDHSRVLMPYCSSDAWLGAQKGTSILERNNTGEQFVFSGKIIFQSAIYELFDQGFSRAREVVLVGSSAGGVGTMNHVQWLQDLMSSRNLQVSISVIIDGGWFLNFQESITSKVVKEFYIIGEPLSGACADSTYGYPCCLSALCMLTRGYYPSTLPTLFVFSMYDIYIIGDVVARMSKRVSVAENGVTNLLTLIESYGGAMNQSLFVFEPGSSNLSYFVPACFQHTFLAMSSLRDEGEALDYSRLFTHGNALFRVTDTCLGPMCNPTCSESLTFVDTAEDWGEVLNGVVLFLSLVLTGVCVAVKICFMVQLLLLEQNQRRYFEEHKETQQVFSHAPGEAITLLRYSSSEVSNHSTNGENLQPVVHEDFNEQSTKAEDTFSSNTIFYRTVQYLRLVFLQNHGYEQFESRDDKRSENEESSGFSRSPTQIYPERRTFCTLSIKNATLGFKQGEFIAIVGKHGAGKTTLLSLLSGRLKCGCKQKHLSMLGSVQKEVQNSYIFLNQFKMPYYGEVTIRRYLGIAALMRLPRKMKTAVKLERVEQIISEMRLNSSAEETFGGSCKKNFTELQKRCFCLANQLITKPRALFLDEPITGLDSTSSIEMLNILKRLCNNGHLVIITMHALPDKTARMYDQLVLLADKQVIFSGDPAKLSDFYDRLSEDNNKTQKGLEDIISDILRNEKIKEATLLQNQSEKRREDDIRSTNANGNPLSSSSESSENGGFLTRLFVIDYRASLSSTSGQTIYLSIMFFVFGVTAGIVYWQAETPLQIMTAYGGSSLPSLLFMGSILHTRINKNLEIRRLESSESIGYSYEHVMQTFLSTSAVCVMPVIACSVLTYFMVFTSYNWWRFVLVTIISLVFNQTWIAVYMLVTYITPSNACHASGVIAALGGFSGGFIVTRSEMPIGAAVRAHDNNLIRSATQPFLGSSRNAPPHVTTRKNGCVADYDYSYLWKDTLHTSGRLHTKFELDGP